VTVAMTRGTSKVATYAELRTVRDVAPTASTTSYCDRH
jgi:hypothetical protein